MTVETLERASAKERDNASFFITILDRLSFYTGLLELFTPVIVPLFAP